MKNKKIKLKRPLVIFDLETTGLNPAKDRIIEIGIIKKFPGRKKEIVKTKFINPGIEIPELITEITGIKDEDVKGAPSFKAVAKSLAELIKDCDIAGYNSNRFDVPFILHEFERAGIYDALDGAKLIDVFNLYCKFNPRTLTHAYAEYCGKTLTPHKAEADTRATLEVLEAIIGEHEHEIEDDSVSGLAELSKKKDNVDVLGIVVKSERGPVFAIGKHKGELVADCLSYCDWVIRASDHSENTKRVIKMIIEGKTGV